MAIPEGPGRTLASNPLDLHEMQGGTVEVEPMPGYLDALNRGASSFMGAVEQCGGCGWELAWGTFQKEAHICLVEVLLLLISAVGWTVLREASTRWLFRESHNCKPPDELQAVDFDAFQPFVQWCEVQPKEAAKVPESAWKLLFYITSWSYSAYLLFFKDYNFFWDPPSAFQGWKSGIAVPLDIALAYLLQGSFYAHATYATIHMDIWRKDSMVMVIHHIVTLVLISFSYVFRYHNIGVLVLFLHDINDIQLEFTKLNIYFKNRGGIYHQLNDILSNIGSVAFSFSWFWFRLYWFPLKVLYATCYSSLQVDPEMPFYFFFNILLFVLTLMNVYWFLYIILFVGKVLTGQLKELNDVREYDDEKASLQSENGGLYHSNAFKGEKTCKNGIVKDKNL